MPSNPGEEGRPLVCSDQDPAAIEGRAAAHEREAHLSAVRGAACLAGLRRPDRVRLVRLDACGGCRSACAAVSPVRRTARRRGRPATAGVLSLRGARPRIGSRRSRSLASPSARRPAGGGTRRPGSGSSLGPTSPSRRMTAPFTKTDLVYAPIWEYSALVAGWEFGFQTRVRCEAVGDEQNERLELRPVREEVKEGRLQERRLYEAAADLAAVGATRPRDHGERASTARCGRRPRRCHGADRARNPQRMSSKAAGGEYWRPRGGGRPRWSAVRRPRVGMSLVLPPLDPRAAHRARSAMRWSSTASRGRSTRRWSRPAATARLKARAARVAPSASWLRSLPSSPSCRRVPVCRRWPSWSWRSWWRWRCFRRSPAQAEVEYHDPYSS